MRHDGNQITSISCSFGTPSVISTTIDGGPQCALVVVEVTAFGAGHTMSVTYGSAGNGNRVWGFVFLDELDLSSQAAWLRDVSTARTTSVTTIDSETTDTVIIGYGCFGGAPPAEPSGTTTICPPFSSVEQDQRVVTLNAPGSPTSTSPASSGSNQSVAMASVIFTESVPPQFRYTSTRADVNPINSPWGNLNGSGLFITGNAIKGNSTDSVSGYVESVTNFSDDQFCEVAFTALGFGDNPGAGVRAQNSGSGLTGYFAHANAGDGRVYVRKWVNGTPSTISAPLTTLTSPLRIEARTVGSNAQISVFAGGAEISGSPFTDSITPITGGQPAVYYSYENVRATSIIEIAGGDLSGGGAPVPPAFFGCNL